MNLVILLFFTAPVLFSNRIDAKKVRATAEPYTNLVPHIRCSVCKLMVTTALSSVERVKNDGLKDGKGRFRQDFIDENIIDPLCHPHTEAGDWLRIIDWKAGNFHIDLEEPPTSGWGRCGRKCWTAAVACEETQREGSFSEKLSAKIYTDLKNRVERSDEKDALYADRLCKKSCSVTLKAREKSQKVGEDLSAITYEVWSEIDSGEKQVEEQMYTMELQQGMSKQGMDVFSRDEMQAMRDALNKGDRAGMEEFDPNAEELSDEELRELQQMMKEQAASWGDTHREENSEL